MKITLAAHTVVEHVGDHLLVLDSDRGVVYCLPRDGITHYTPETHTLVVTHELTPEAHALVDAGLATIPGTVSRRAVVGSTGVVVAGGLVAMSMPAVAASQSPGPNIGGGGNGGDPEGEENGSGDVLSLGLAGAWVATDVGKNGTFTDLSFSAGFLDDLFTGWGPVSTWTVTVFDATLTPADFDQSLGIFTFFFESGPHPIATQQLGELWDLDDEDPEAGTLTVLVTDGVRTAEVELNRLGDQSELLGFLYGTDRWTFAGGDPDELDIVIDLSGINLVGRGFPNQWSITIFGTTYPLSGADDLDFDGDTGLLSIEELTIVDVENTPFEEWADNRCDFTDDIDSLTIEGVELRDKDGDLLKTFRLVYDRESLIFECEL